VKRLSLRRFLHSSRFIICRSLIIIPGKRVTAWRSVNELSRRRKKTSKARKRELRPRERDTIWCFRCLTNAPSINSHFSRIMALVSRRRPRSSKSKRTRNRDGGREANVSLRLPPNCYEEGLLGRWRQRAVGGIKVSVRRSR
jgi:hypothetical protein